MCLKTSLVASGLVLWACCGVSNGGDQGVCIDPSLISSFAGDGGNILRFSVSGTTLMSPENDGLHLYDIQDPSQPFYLGTWSSSGRAFDAELVDDLLVIANVDEGLQLVDVSDPSAPMLLGSFDTIGQGLSVEVVGDIAYLAGADQGLYVFDISTPATPMLLMQVSTNDYASHLEIDGDRMFVADREGGLMAMDISDPASPVVLGSVGYENAYAQDVTIGDGFAYIADLQTDMVIVDISDLTSMQVAGTYTDLPARFESVTYQDGYLYIGRDWVGLEIFDMSDPLVPVFVSSYDTPNEANWVRVQGEVAYVADRSSMIVLDIENTCVASCDGDLDGDGQITFLDISAWLVAYLGGDPLADLDGNGLINQFDAVLLISYYDQGCP